MRNETLPTEQQQRKIDFICAKHSNKEQEYARCLEKTVNVEIVNDPALLFSGLFN